MSYKFSGQLLAGALLCSALCTVPLSAISEGNVLVVFNSANGDSQEVKDYYVSIRPDVLQFDLADGSLTSPTINYADFATKIRDPIRQHLNSNNLEQTVEVLVLTKGIPHRIQSLDTNNPNAGDAGASATTAYDNGNASFASVDSELTLLQYDLDDGENGGNYDSSADNAVLNPYFNETSAFSSFSRSSIANGDQVFSRSNNVYGWWALGTQVIRGINVSFTPSDAGDIYLTARLDASTVEDVKAIIDRAQDIAFRRDIDAVIFDGDGRSNPLDEYSDPSTGTAINDYPEAESTVSATWDQVLRENSSSFVIGKAAGIDYSNTLLINGPIAHLHSYGVNHSGTNSQIRPYLNTFAGQLVPGASFSAYESFGAKGLGGLGNSNQGQVEEWFSSGGTFASGPVWEPFTFGILKSEIFLDRFYNQGFTYVEAAWAAILQISWQSVVIGDPLATASFRASSEYESWVYAGTGTTPDVEVTAGFDDDYDLDGLENGLEYTLALNPDASDVNSNKLPEFTLSSENKVVTFTLADPVPTNLDITVEMSPSLEPGSWTIIATRGSGGTWSGTATVVESNTASGNEVELIDHTTGLDDRRFYRISVTQI
ncbi:hypothetical protein DDZ13_10635 [Coraliomargarita sinensis]|uniref:TIGR03790 family protein n=1 Tax=Coraliomargarita sinensis TaxID=2174842 RepID=A0A317ZHM9_9BACT|nr:hypothetical protein [Coraliomargarita sinensis]PXA03743.1 hypothetical protein DDZ13_10635 [Coraliomargarita sinensis]